MDLNIFIDKCPAHPPDTDLLRNIKVAFFSANCTSHLHPLDLGIIHSMKAKYRKALVQNVSYMEMNKHLQLSILQGMHMVTAAWNSVTPQTISNCFHKAAFNCNNAMETAVDMDVIDHENWLKIAPHMDTNFDEFVQCDDLESTSGPPQDREEICDAKQVEEEEEETIQEEESVPILGEVVQALEVVRRYLTSFDVDSTTISKVNYLEQEVLNVQSTPQKKQASLLDYFNK
jgi:hypothetical protein